MQKTQAVKHTQSAVQAAMSNTKINVTESMFQSKGIKNPAGCKQGEKLVNRQVNLRLAGRSVLHSEMFSFKPHFGQGFKLFMVGSIKEGKLSSLIID